MNKITKAVASLHANPDFAHALRLSAAVGAINDDLLSLEIPSHNNETTTISSLFKSGLDHDVFTSMFLLSKYKARNFYQLTTFGKQVLAQFEPELAIPNEIPEDQEILYVQFLFYILACKENISLEFRKTLQHGNSAVTCDVYQQSSNEPLVIVILPGTKGKRLPRFINLMQSWQAYAKSIDKSLKIFFVPVLYRENTEIDVQLLQEVLRDYAPNIQAYLLLIEDLKTSKRLHTTLSEKSSWIEPLAQGKPGVSPENSFTDLINYHSQVVEEDDQQYIQPWETLAAMMRVAMMFYTHWEKINTKGLISQSTLDELKKYLMSPNFSTAHKILKTVLLEAEKKDFNHYCMTLNAGLRFILRKKFRIDTGSAFQVWVEVNVNSGEHKVCCNMNNEEFTAFKKRFRLTEKHMEALEWMLEFLLHYAPELDLANDSWDKI